MIHHRPTQGGPNWGRNGTEGVTFPVDLQRHTMNVLLIGSGGREHALAWALSASPLIGHWDGPTASPRRSRPA